MRAHEKQISKAIPSPQEGHWESNPETGNLVNNKKAYKTNQE
jgi:hypothetical protein